MDVPISPVEEEGAEGMGEVIAKSGPEPCGPERSGVTGEIVRPGGNTWTDSTSRRCAGV